MFIPHNSTYNDSTTIFNNLDPPKGDPQITDGASWLPKEALRSRLPGAHCCQSKQSNLCRSNTKVTEKKNIKSE